MNNSIADLCKRSHEISVSRGWLDGSPRPLNLICRLIKSELYEAFEDWRANKGLTEVYYEYYLGPKAAMNKAVASGMDEDERAEFKKNYPDAKPCGIPIELADVAIRIAQHCGTEGQPLEEYMAKNPYKMHEEDRHDFLEFLDAVESHVNYAQEQGGLHSYAGFGAAMSLLFSFCDDNDIDLWAAIHEKEAFNTKREYRHGGKKA